MKIHGNYKEQNFNKPAMGSLIKPSWKLAYFFRPAKRLIAESVMLSQHRLTLYQLIKREDELLLDFAGCLSN